MNVRYRKIGSAGYSAHLLREGREIYLGRIYPSAGRAWRADRPDHAALTWHRAMGTQFTSREAAAAALRIEFIRSTS